MVSRSKLSYQAAQIGIRSHQLVPENGPMFRLPEFFIAKTEIKTFLDRDMALRGRAEGEKVMDGSKCRVFVS